MKHLIIAVASILLCSIALPKTLTVSVQVENPSALARQAETIEVAWKTIHQRAPTLDSTAVIVRDPRGKPLASQTFEGFLLFQTDLKGRERKVFTIEAGKDAPHATSTFAGFMKPREDVAWESDKIAFRMYGPALAKEGVNNGFDVWTKRVPYPIVEKWYSGDEREGEARVSYHVDHGEGADFFSVGSSLGAGSCAPYKNGKLYQPGVFATHHVIATGPIRACFEVTYNEWDVDGVRCSETQRIALDAGHHLNRIVVTYHVQRPLTIAMGLAKRAGTHTDFDTKHGWVSLWGATNESPENGSLGTAVLLNSRFLKGTAEDSVHACLLADVAPGTALVYSAGAGWTNRGDFSTQKDWTGYLSAEAARLAAPVTMTLTVRSR